MTKILFFGRIGDLAGCTEMSCELPAEVKTLAALRAWLIEREPLLAEAIVSPSVRVAINRIFSQHDGPIEAKDEIAFMSPLSGG
jgi:molybdopterin synthase sulfur carrier subunit